MSDTPTTPSPQARDFGVQSYCFRHFKDNKTVAEKVRGIGLDKIELCGVHADFDKPDEVGALVEVYRAAGVEVVSIGVETLGADEGFIRRRLECVTAAGAKHMSVHFKVDDFHESVPLAAKLAAEHGVRLAIHCHGGYMFGGDVPTLQHLLSLDPTGETVGVCIDTAWAIQAGGPRHDCAQWAGETFAGRVFGVHYKDFVFDEHGATRDVIVGEGALDLPAFVKGLDRGGFDGYAVIEYEADVESPDAALTRCVEAMRAAL